MNVTIARSCEEIANECMKNGIVLAGTQTKGDMFRKLRRATEEQMVVTFGKHKGKTFGEVRTNWPGYAAVVMKAASEDKEASPNLKSLARWLVEVDGVDDGPDQDVLPMTRSASRPTAGEMTPGSLDLDPPSRTGGCRGRPRSTGAASW